MHSAGCLTGKQWNLPAAHGCKATLGSLQLLQRTMLTPHSQNVERAHPACACRSAKELTMIRPILALACLSMGFGLLACAVDVAEQNREVQPITDDLRKGNGVPSTKASAFFGDIAILDSAELSWSNIMTTRIKTSNGKTLFINPSLECGLYTQTTVRSQRGRKDTSTASATVQMQVLVDGVPAQPGVVVYCSRIQQLSGTLGGILQSCSDVDGDGTTTAEECELSDEEISLLLNTMDATSFNFGADVGAGVHTVTVQAKISTSTSRQTGSATALATIGKGAVVVTEQRL
jgi:hypothetical protein